MNRLLGILMVGLPLAAFAADANPDASFFKHAAEGGIFEVDVGNLAQQKSDNEQVKDFGAMMVKDHSAANQKLQSIAASKNITLPTSASAGQLATKAKLELLSGDSFDKSYIGSQIKAHEQTIELFKKEIGAGQDPDAKAFATETLPTVRAHLKAIRSVAVAAGVPK
jgi:putative membrane protein